MAQLTELRRTALSFYDDLNHLVALHYPEIPLIHGVDEMQEMLRSRAERAAEEYYRLIDSGENTRTALELTRKELVTDLGDSYSDEAADVLEEYPEIYQQIKELDDEAFTAFFAEIAKRIYFDLNDDDARKSRLYIPPYIDGYTKEEEDKIKQLTIKAYNSLSKEAFNNA